MNKFAAVPFIEHPKNDKDEKKGQHRLLFYPRGYDSNIKDKHEV